MKWLSILPRIFYALTSIILVGIALLLLGYALLEIYHAMSIDSTRTINELLNAIGIVVISTALVDVSKFLVEEEVIRKKQSLPSTREIRRSLTKFLSIITIAVCMEALVFIFKAGKSGNSSLIYPTLLLLAGVGVVVGLGVFLRMVPGSSLANSDTDDLPVTSTENRS